MTGPDAAGGGLPATEREPAAPARDGPGPWLRLDRRMLLVHPVQELVKFLPAVIGAVILGVSSGNPVYSLLGLVFVVPYALTLWFTTTYRIGPTHLELRTGLVRRKRLSVPRARIRSVDIEADPLHRILGLAVVVIGTGREAGAEDRFRLDALAAGHVRPLRAELLAHTRDTAAGDPVPDRLPDEAESTGPGGLGGEEIGHWQPGWVRYAPLSLTGFALAASALGVAAQFGFGAAEISISRNTVDSVRDSGLLSLLLLTLGALAAMVAVVSIAACAHYLATNFGLRVTDYGGTLQIRRGLFTLRRITLDTARLRGATVCEPLLLRLAGAAQLEAVMTGENPRQKILPQSPRAAVERTLASLLSPRRTAAAAGGPAPPAARLSTLVEIPLTRHGPAARRRRYLRACWPVPLLLAILITTSIAGLHTPGWSWLLILALTPVCALLAEDRYRGLGHTVVPGTDGSPTWLIVGSGSLDRERTCLEAPGIIGWTVRQTFWQRRAGLATVGAATAAGKQSYLIRDVPLEQAWVVLDQLGSVVRPAFGGAVSGSA